MDEKLRILLCEDDENLGMLLREYLQAKGYSAELCPDGEAGYKAFLKNKYDLCVLDVMMPKKDGFTLAQEIRQANAEIPIIFLTAKTLKEDILEGFKIGADDYITKPFNPRELTIRARNLLSRTMNLGTVSEERRSVESYKFNGWELDINSRSLVSPNGEQYKLPRSEFRAMLHFCENPGKIQSRAELLKKMTGRELKPHDRTVDVTIRRIRKHFESTPDTPEIIATIHGEGYRFCGDLQE